MKRVVVVGAGVIGLYCAVRLAMHGAQVTLLDGRDEDLDLWSATASANAAGMLAPVGDEYGAHDRLAMDSLALWRAHRDGAEWADAVRFEGVVISTESVERAEDYLTRARALGARADTLPPARARKLTGFDSPLPNALFIEDEGTAEPLRTLTGLAMQARALGVLIEYGAEAMNVEAHRVVCHDDRVFEADAVVVAPGVWATKRLMAGAPCLQRIEPAKGHMAGVAAPERLRANFRAPGFYLARRREEVALGSTMESGRYDRFVKSEAIEALLARAKALLGDDVVYLDRAWAGVRPMSPDGWPMVGRDVGGVLVAAGHSRNGWLLAPITAEIISAYVFDREIAPEWAALAPQRFDVRSTN
jgi:glycine oxidase